MPRIYASIPKFKKIHQALVATARQNETVLKEIDTFLAGPRSDEETEMLNDLREQCTTLRQLYIEVAESVAGVKKPRSQDR